MDIPQIEFVEAVTGEPILSQPLADGRLHEDGPDLDDLGQEVCEECNEVKPKGTRCLCADDAPDAEDYPDCTRCGGVGTLSVTYKGATTHPACPHCGESGKEPR